MKQEATNKKSKLWIWLAVGAVVLAAILGVGAFLLFGQGEPAPEGPTGGRAEIYWNVDRVKFTENSATGLSTREPGADGMYLIKFAIEGEHVEFACADKKLVNRIDMMDAVCLVLGEDGSIVDAVDPATVATLGANRLYIQDINDQTITINSSSALNGLVMEFAISDVTRIYDVSPDAGFCGEAFTPDIMDQVIIYQNDLGETTHVFVSQRVTESAIYWRLNRFYDSSQKTTTREPDENGVYTIPFSSNGKDVTLQTKDKDIVTAVDKKGTTSCYFAFKFDAEGYIVEIVNAGMAIRGVVECSKYEVTAIDGNNFTLTRLLSGSSVGREYSNTITENTRIYNYTSTADQIGEATELQLNDRVYCLVNARGEVRYLLIMNRMVDSPMYYSLEKEDVTDGVTERQPENGWYVFDVAGDGGNRTVRTRDVKLATAIDSKNNRCFGLKLNGNVIEKVYAPMCVTGGSYFAPLQYVTNIAGTVISTKSYASKTTSNGVMNADCKVYNVAAWADVQGERTQLQVNDRIVSYKNVYGEVAVIFVTRRQLDASYTAYWNLNRQYDDGTTREPDENGFYVFDVMDFNGNITTVKTSSKEIADEMEAKSPAMFAVRVRNGEVVDVQNPWHTFIGGTRYPYRYYFESYDEDGKITAKKYSSTSGKVSTIHPKLAEDCVVYNVSEDYQNYKGERTTLRPGDYISGIRNAANRITHIFVVRREVDSPLYYHKDRISSHEPDENGWYHYELWCDGQAKNLRTNNPQYAKKLDDYASYEPFGLRIEGDVITRVYSYAYTKVGHGTTCARYDIVSLSGNSAWLRYNRPGYSYTGKEVQIKFASSYKAYDACSWSETFGQEVELQVGDRINCITNFYGEVVYVLVNSRATREAGARSVCPHCNKEVYWEPFTGSFVRNSRAGDVHYYLTADFENKSTVLLGSSSYDISIVLDLNGKTFHSTSRALSISKNEELTIIDTSKAQTGAMIADGYVDPEDPKSVKDGEYGGVMRAFEGGKINIYGGTYSTTGVNNIYRGGVAYVTGEGSEINLYGGKFVGATTTSYGAGVYVAKKGSFGMYGGELVGGTTPSNGGALYASSSVETGKVTLVGGKITGGTAENGNSLYTTGGNITIGGNIQIAGDVAIRSQAKLTLEGKPVITMGQMYGLNVKEPAFADATKLEKGASISVSAVGQFTQKFASTAAAKAAIKHFKPDQDDMTIFVYEDALWYGTGTLRCINGHDMGDPAHKNCTEPLMDWRPWNDAESLPDAGNYYLTTDVTISAMVTLTGSLNLDLAGHDICRTVDADSKTVRVYYVKGTDYKLTITDTSSDKAEEQGRLYHVVSAPSEIASDGNRCGVIVRVMTGAFELRGGNLDGSGYNGDATGNATVYVDKGESFTMLGGTITGTDNTSKGSGLYVAIGGTATVSGGTVYGGKASQGAAVYNVGNVTIDGTAVIVPGEAITAGDGIYVDDKEAVLTIAGEATVQGGVQINRAQQVSLKDTATIDKTGTATTYSLKSAVPVDVSELKEGAKVYVNAESVFTTEMDKTQAQKLLDSESILSDSDMKLRVTDAGALEAYLDSANRMRCAYGHESHSGIDCDAEMIVWSEWPETDSLPSTGNWYLSGNVTITATVKPNDLKLDLNGYNIQRFIEVGAADECNIFRPVADKVFVLTDTDPEKEGTLSVAWAEGAETANASKLGKIIRIDPAAIVKMYGGIVDGSNITGNTNTSSNGVINVENGGGKYAQFYMYGGKVIGMDNGTKKGSAIIARNKCTVEIYGGEIVGGTCNKGTGSALYLGDGPLAVGGNAKITGAIYLTEDLSVVTLKGEPQIQLLIIGSGADNAINATELDTGAVIAVKNNRTDKSVAFANVSKALPGVTASTTDYVVIYNEADGTLTMEEVAQPTDPSSEPTDPSSEPTDPSSEPTDPSSEPTDPSSEPTDPSSEPTDPSSEPTDPSSEPTDPSSEPTEPVVPVAKTYCIEGHTSHEGITCEQSLLTWEPWTETESLPISGNWYLTENVTVTTMVTVSESLNLDLAGKDIHRTVGAESTNVRVYYVKGTGAKLTITDTSSDKAEEQGKIYLTVTEVSEEVSAGNRRGVVISVNKGEFELRGGILDGSAYNGNAYGNATVFIDSDDSFTMLGGTVIGSNNSGSNGSAVYCSGKTTITISGGTIVGGTASRGAAIYSAGALTVKDNVELVAGSASQGECIYVSNDAATVTIQNVTIPGGVYVEKAASVSISGNTVIDAEGGNATADLFCNIENVTPNITQLGDDAKIVLTGTGALATADQAAQYIADGKIVTRVHQNTITAEGTTITVVAPTGAVEYCAYGHTTHEGVQCDAEIIAWEAWSETDSLPVSGNYYLTSNVRIGQTVKPTDLKLDVNGFNITRELVAGTTDECNVFTITEGNILLLTDSDPDREGVLSVTYAVGGEQVNLAKRGKVVKVAANGTMKMYGGVLDGSNVTRNTSSTANGTLIVENATDKYDAKFYMYGGKIIGISNEKDDGNGGVTKDNGSAIATHTKVSVEIYGGEIVGGRAKTGSGFYAGSGGSVVIGGNVIIDGSVYVNSDASRFVLKGEPQISSMVVGSSSTGAINAVGLETGAQIRVNNAREDKTVAFATVSKELPGITTNNEGFEIVYDAVHGTLAMAAVQVEG